MGSGCSQESETDGKKEMVLDSPTTKPSTQFHSREPSQQLYRAKNIPPQAKYTSFPSKVAQYYEHKSDSHLKLARIIPTSHVRQITAIAISGDGKYVATACRSKDVKIWDFDTETCVQTFLGHTDIVATVSISDKGAYVASGGLDKSVRIWQMSNGECLKVIKEFEDSIKKVKFTVDDDLVVCGRGEAGIKVFDVNGETKEVIPQTGITVMDSSNDGKFAVFDRIEREKYQVVIWSLEPEKKESGQLKLEKGPSLVCISNLGNYVAVVLNDIIQLHDFKTLRVLQTLEGHSKVIEAVNITHDEKYLVSISYDNTIIVWDLQNGKQVKKIEESSGNIFSAVISPDSQFLLTEGENYAINVWEMPESKASV